MKLLCVFRLQRIRDGVCVVQDPGEIRELSGEGELQPGPQLPEEIILSTSKSNGDQFLALLRSSTSSARKAKEPAEVHSPATAPAPAEPPAKIETIDVS